MKCYFFYIEAVKLNNMKPTMEVDFAFLCYLENYHD